MKGFEIQDMKRTMNFWIDDEKNPSILLNRKNTCVLVLTHVVYGLLIRAGIQ
jgi:hypothetical protein